MDSPSPPPAPDYVGAAQQTAAGNLDAIKYQTDANRINQYTPWGSLTYKNTPSFDQTGYDSAVANWQKGNSQGTWVPGTPGGQGFGGGEGGGDFSPATEGHWEGATSNSTPMPDKADYTHDGWSQTTALTPEAQHALDSQLAIQQGKSDQANSMLQSVKDSYNQPFVAPDRATYMNGVGAVNQGSVGQAGTYTPSTNQNLNFSGSAPSLTTDYARFASLSPGLDTSAYSFNGAGAGQDTRNLAASKYAGMMGVQGANQNAESMMGGVNAVNQNAPQFDPNQASMYAKKSYDAQMALLQPGLDDQQQKLQNSLALQGLNVGTEANHNAQSAQSLARAAQENALANSSYLSGAQVAQGNYASQLAGFNAGNSAQNQAYTQNMGIFSADNAARAQALQSALGLQQGDLASQAQSNAARNTTFGQNQSIFNTNQNATNNSNSARATQAGIDLSSFNANTNATSAENAARSQSLAQQLATYQAQNQARAQQTAQDQSAYALNLQGLTTNQALNSAQNQAQAQAYQQSLQNYSTDWQQAETLRNQPLNELNALLTGQQVQNPQFNSYALQGATSGPDYLGATTAQSNYNQGIFNANNASNASNNSTMASLAGAAAMAISFY